MDELLSVVETVPFSSADEVLVGFGSRAMSSQGTPNDNAEAILEYLDSSELPTPDAILSGGAEGADAAFEALSLRLGVPMLVLPAGGPSDGTVFRKRLAEERDIEWVVESVAEYGGGLGPSTNSEVPLARNCAMAELASQYEARGLGCHNGRSSGTERMFASCESHGVPAERWVYPDA